MKRLVAGAIILVQLWLLSPVCCCWFKAAAKPGSGDCCCSQSEEGTDEQTPVEQSSNCRCSENKVQLPPQIISAGDSSSQRLSLDQLLLVPTQRAIVAEPDCPRDSVKRPPPLAVSDRLANLHRLNL